MTGRRGRRASSRALGLRDQASSGRGSIWIPTGGPSLSSLDPLDLYNPRLELPHPWLRVFAERSGANFLDVGEVLDALKTALPEDEWPLRCGRLGIHWRDALLLIRATSLMDFRLRYTPKPPATVFWRVATFRSARTDWGERLLDWIVDHWSRRAFGSRHMIEALHQGISLAARPRYDDPRNYIEIVGYGKRRYRLRLDDMWRETESTMNELSNETSRSFCGVPSFFAGCCHAAHVDAEIGYFGAGHELARHLESLVPEPVSKKDWHHFLVELKGFFRDADDAAAWNWFQTWYPRCMELVPPAQSDEFIAGAKTAAARKLF